jgi:hypothetical protein
MKNLLEQLENLKIALNEKSISVNEYCEFYFSISQKIKSLKN